MRRCLVLSVALAGCYAVRVPDVAERPAWQVTSGETYASGCLLARALPRKSGREGLGLSVQLRSRGDCAVAITGARLQVGPRGADVAALPAPLAMRGRSQLYAWLPFHFDGLAAWNAGDTRAKLVIAIAIDGVPQPPWTIALADALGVAPP